MNKIIISHYSDVLCVWAYVSQIRMDELKENFAESVDIDYYFFSVFGNALEKLNKGWREKGGMEAYSKHVKKVVADFGHLDVHPNVWLKDAPHSSLPGHLYLCAAQLAEKNEMIEVGAFHKLTWKMRESFFSEGKDISNISVINEVLEEQGLPIAQFEKIIASGEAYAVVCKHMHNALDNNVRSSPTLTFNEDRQRLTGNVGYRILEANIRELLEKPEEQQTWC